MKMLEQIEQAHPSGAAGCDFEDDASAEEAVPDDVEIRLRRAHLGLHGIDLCG
jgi:hypothetical protein